MGMMSKKQNNLINITPFVDVLLFMFIIILVASNFSDTVETKVAESTVLTKELEEKSQKVKELEKILSTTKDNDSLLKLKQENQNLADKNKKVEEELKKVQKQLEQKQEPKNHIAFHQDGSIVVNNQKLSYKDVVSVAKIFALDGIMYYYPRDKNSYGYEVYEQFVIDVEGGGKR